jgi:hypothetical protein
MRVHRKRKVFAITVSLHREILLSAFTDQTQRDLVRSGRPHAKLTLIVLRPHSQHVTGFANQGSFHVC